MVRDPCGLTKEVGVAFTRLMATSAGRTVRISAGLVLLVVGSLFGGAWWIMAVQRTHDEGSLKLRVGKHTASFLRYKFCAAVAPSPFPASLAASRGALNSGVNPTGSRGSKPAGSGRSSAY